MILKTNPDKALSSIELENALNAKRHSINQALRSLRHRGLIKYGLVKEGKRKVGYAILKREEDDKG